MRLATRPDGLDSRVAAGGSWSRARQYGVWAAAVASWGLLLFTYRHLGTLVDGETELWLAPFIDEMTGGLAGGLWFFFVLAIARRFPISRDQWLSRLPLYLAGLVIYAAADTTTMWILREMLYPLSGLGDYDYGIMPLRYLMELPMQLIGFCVMVGAIHAVGAYRAARERELRTAQLERNLAQAQLRNLRLQLQPHFLFNALNTISATMYEDPAAADEMLDKLAELLRASLRTTQTDEVPLRVELELLDRYLAIMKARFGDRLQVRIETSPEVAEALVPSMILQPLVENAIRHGRVSQAGAGSVEVRVKQHDSRLVLEVEDDGTGTSNGSDRDPGVGHTATAERLQLLYGDSQSFEAGVKTSGRFLVRATLPCRRTEAA